MKPYQQPIKVTGNSANVTLAQLWPQFEKNDPKTGDYIYAYYDRRGTYVGWTNQIVGKKFLYAGLYYKTKGDVTTHTAGERFSRRRKEGDKTITITQKSTGQMYITIKGFTVLSKHLIDIDSRMEVLQAAESSIKSYLFDVYSYSSFPDEYKLFPPTWRSDMQKRMAAFLANEKKMVLEFIEGEKRKDTIQRRKIEEHGIDMTAF